MARSGAILDQKDAVGEAHDTADRRIGRDPAAVMDAVTAAATALGRQGYGVSRITPATLAEQ